MLALGALGSLSGRRISLSDGENEEDALDRLLDERLTDLLD